MRRFLVGALLLSALGASADVVIVNARFRLVLGDDAVPRSLVVAGTGEEMLAPARGQPLFSVTQERPFNNEVKLSYPNARTTYRAKSVRRDGDRLVVGFEQAAYSAVFRLTEAEDYVAFTLEGFEDARTAYAGLKLDCPPVCGVRLVDLPVRRRAQFGSWLNVVWDDSCAVAVIAASVDELISGERRDDGVRLVADASSAVRTVGATALLVASETPRFLDCIDAAEVAFGMPRGVASRRSKEIRQSTLSTFVCPTNVEEVIAFAHQGGFRNVLLNYGHIVKESGSWELCGNYDFRPDYPNGFADLRAVFERLKAAGLTPGLHFLSTHIGMKSRYVTPVADPRLGLKRRYTLAAPLAADATELAVEEDPRLAPAFESLRVLKFGGELIRYDARTAQRPYRFTGLTRGAFGTRATAHAAGTIGGVLDVCEYGGMKSPGSCYLDPDTSLADEIAEKLARLCNCGAEFLYMDGAEGVKPPYGHYVARAQKLVWDRLAVAPKFAEGAAKAHFSWHMLSAANAYDQFLPHVFERCVARYPVEGAKEMAKSFTQVDFGWWGIVEPYEGIHGGTQPDLWEWGLKLAVAYDAPITVQCRGAAELKALGVPLDELLAVSKRWLTAREKGFFTPEMKRRLRDTSVRHVLRERPDGTYALVERPRDPPLPDPKAVAVTDMNPGVLLKVSPVEITDGVPCAFYAAKPGRHYFWGAADGAAESQTVVEVASPGFVRFVPPGRRYALKMTTAPTAVWRDDGGWTFLSPDRFWRDVSPAPARPLTRAAARPSEADLARVRAVVDGTRFARGEKARKVVVFADASSGFGAEVCRFAATRAGLFSVDVETAAARLDDADFLSGYDAAVLCGPLACGGAEESALPPALAAFVARGKGLALLHGQTTPGGSCACRAVRSRTSKDLERWTEKEMVMRLPPEVKATAVWAPEVHAYKGAYWLFATLTFEAVKPGAAAAPSYLKPIQPLLAKGFAGGALQPRGVWVFRSDSPRGPFVPVKMGPVTPSEWMCLDGTLWVENGEPWMVFCHEWCQTGNGRMMAAPTSDDLSRFTAEPVELFRAADAPNGGFVTDGPFLRRTRDGVLRMIWSNFIKDSGYCVLQCASASGSVRGPWKGHVPLFTHDGGHGMIFSRTDGTQLLTIHQPNTSPGERMRLFPIRETAVGFVCESGK